MKTETTFRHDNGNYELRLDTDWYGPLGTRGALTELQGLPVDVAGRPWPAVMLAGHKRLPFGALGVIAPEMTLLRDHIARLDGTRCERAAADLARVLAAALVVDREGLVARTWLRPGRVGLTVDGQLVLLGVGVDDPTRGLGALRRWLDLAPPLRAHLAPEQVRGTDAGTATRIWQIGTLALTLALGRPAHSDAVQAIRRASQGGAGLDALSRWLVPSRLRELLAAMLAREPARRPAPFAVLEAAQAILDSPEDPPDGPEDPPGGPRAPPAGPAPRPRCVPSIRPVRVPARRAPHLRVVT